MQLGLHFLSLSRSLALSLSRARALFLSSPDHPYNQSGAEADIERWRKDDLPIDIWGLDMDWRIWAHGEEGKGYFINTKLFPDMAGFYKFAHEHGLSVYMNDHPMAKSDQLSPEETSFRCVRRPVG